MKEKRSTTWANEEDGKEKGKVRTRDGGKASTSSLTTATLVRERGIIQERVNRGMETTTRAKARAKDSKANATGVASGATARTTVQVNTIT